MSSIRSQISSRRNGALSKGPVTEAGKRRSSLNAERHGLLSRHTVCGLENPEAFDEVINDHAGTLQPANGVEEGLIEEMASAWWRMQRLRAMETGMMDQALNATPQDDPTLARLIAAFSHLADTNAFRLLDLYEGRLHRRYHRAMSTFFLLREKTQPEPAKPETIPPTDEPASSVEPEPPASNPTAPVRNEPAACTTEENSLDKRTGFTESLPLDPTPTQPREAPIEPVIVEFGASSLANQPQRPCRSSSNNPCIPRCK